MKKILVFLIFCTIFSFPVFSQDYHVPNNPNGNDVKAGSAGNKTTGVVIIGINGPRAGGTHLALDDNEIMARNGDNPSFIALQHDGGEIRIHSGLTKSKRVNIDVDGNVSIGTDEHPGDYKLAVDGKIISEEVRVEAAGDEQGEWPDYVFKPGYNLLSLPELEQSIQQNGHLPGMPTAAEVKENGIELGDMNRRLLEKVEELTLYVIELKKETEELEAENEKIKKTNKELTGRLETLESKNH